MPAQKRHKTRYAGVYFIEGKAIGSTKKERIYYIMYRKNGKQIHEKAGRQFADGMTPARAAGLRSERIEGKKPTNKEKRMAEEAAKRAESGKWTIDKLWTEYKAGRKKNKALSTDLGRYEKYLKNRFGNKEPKDIISLDVEHLRRRLLKSKSPQTTRHVLNLLTWIINFGVKNGLCSGLSFHVNKPTVHNEKTEDLTPIQLQNLLNAIIKDDHPQAGPMMLLALYSGMRRSEMFKLRWKDVDFDKDFIHIRDPKGGQSQRIPMNASAKTLLENHPKTPNSPFIFPGRGGNQRTDINKALTKIKLNAKLPKNFRPVHGLRHVFASMLASSGKVDLYHLQKLLTHKDSRMTQRYAHLRDEALKKASNLAGSIIEQATKDVKNEKENVVNLDDHKK